jgi:hypothetical protein
MGLPRKREGLHPRAERSERIIFEEESNGKKDGEMNRFSNSATMSLRA